MAKYCSISGQERGAGWVSDGSLGMEQESDCSEVKDHSLESHRQIENKSLVRLMKLRDRSSGTSLCRPSSIMWKPETMWTHWQNQTHFQRMVGPIHKLAIATITQIRGRKEQKQTAEESTSQGKITQKLQGDSRQKKKKKNNHQPTKQQQQKSQKPSTDAKQFQET